MPLARRALDSGRSAVSALGDTRPSSRDPLPPADARDAEPAAEPEPQAVGVTRARTAEVRERRRSDAARAADERALARVFNWYTLASFEQTRGQVRGSGTSIRLGSGN